MGLFTALMIANYSYKLIYIYVHANIFCSGYTLDDKKNIQIETNAYSCFLKAKNTLHSVAAPSQYSIRELPKSKIINTYLSY